MKKPYYRIMRHPLFSEWFEKQTFKAQDQIEKRFELIEWDAHFGDHYCIEQTHKIFELKWKKWAQNLFYSHR